MNTLLILYLIYLSWGTVGQGRVSILEMSRYLRRSKSQTRSDLFSLADSGLVEIITLYSDAGAKKYFVQLTSLGDDFLMQRFDAAIDVYHQHVAETVLAMKERAKESEFSPKRMSKKERAAIAAGQMKMEGF